METKSLYLEARDPAAQSESYNNFSVNFGKKLSPVALRFFPHRLEMIKEELS